jgi:membrane associated rhomboid family serine protease
MAIFSSIWDDFRNAFRSGNMVTKLVLVNFSVFVLVKIAYVALWMSMGGQEVRGLFFEGLRHLCLPADIMGLLTHLWTPFTSIFLHESLFHLINNIIGLYLFGSIVSDLVGDRRVLPIYLAGGLVGGLLFIVSANLVPHIGSYALGASGAVMALGGAALILAPDYRVPLLLLGEVKVKYIVLVLLLLDLVGIANQSNTGGHIAHLGGFFFGAWFVYRLRDGYDMALPINRLLDSISGWFTARSSVPGRQVADRRPLQKVYQNPIGKPSHTPSFNPASERAFQEKLDAILDKIKAEGYENLTPEEKEFLFLASKK